MSIDLLHGVVDEWTADLWSHRIYVSRDSLRRYLSTRPSKYASWSVNGGSQDVLTIDDATQAGADACALARELGHEVTFFINPFNVSARVPYILSWLDAYLDGRTSCRLSFEDQSFDLSKKHSIRHFREMAKNDLKTKNQETASLGLSHFQTLLGAEGVVLQSHVLPISTTTVKELHSIGVKIANHGWDHIDVVDISQSRFTQHVKLARDWIADTLNCDERVYACPFGEQLVADPLRKVVNGAYLLADPARPYGQIDSSCWNRIDISQLVRGTL